ncbi:hypothetical protein [Paenarthrobacter sp. TA1.8]|uniref:hypothetical protein n=1 Tax=Paenarthrobacter sp. TA1.8 TaxID=3400219 RepID=UPI003B439EBE
MELGEKLLSLTVEYAAAVSGPALMASAAQSYSGRTPAEIGAEYETTLRTLLTPQQ